MQDFTIKIDASSLNRLRDAGVDLRDLSRPVAEYVTYQEAQTRLNFAKESDSEGQRWKDLKPETWKRKKTKAIGRETSTLVNAVSSNARGSSGMVFNNTEYAAPFQAERPFMGVSDKNLREAQGIFTRFIRGLLSDA